MADQSFSNQAVVEPVTSEQPSTKRVSRVEIDSEPGLTTLLTGIVRDAQELLRQQLSLFQVEFKNDMRRTAAAVASLAAGGIVCLVAGIMLAAALALVLAYFVPSVPLWGWFAIVGAVLAALGASMIFWGKSRFDRFNPLGDKSVQGLMENVQWKTRT